ncbi:chymotrypsin-like [Anopheles ziemanni]|uniref:chymotrypsin-like n=1 Tax=Anopheles coustani TaxID=139045 RepID=UPI00265889AE|nr:chymotrypsin-like [Anopheles coustani]XP_058178010.1 chymotrypsin-like [Anopheles ziemanni]
MKVVLLLSALAVGGVFAIGSPSDSAEPNSRIAGGEETDPRAVPFIVGILISGSNRHAFCAGILISPTHVLTTASCVSNQPILTVLLGASDMTRIQEFIGVASILIHPNYSSLLNRDDVAILTMDRATPLNEYIQVANLPRWGHVGNTFNGFGTTVSGWGNTGNRDNEPVPIPNLNSIRTPVISNTVCGLSHNFIRDDHICTSGDNGGPCDGDDGGPVTITDAGETIVIGMHSFHYSGLFGCDRGRSAVHIRLTSYLSWIEANSNAIIRT